jgi:hypothetical protein
MNLIGASSEDRRLRLLQHQKEGLLVWAPRNLAGMETKYQTETGMVTTIVIPMGMVLVIHRHHLMGHLPLVMVFHIPQ